MGLINQADVGAVGNVSISVPPSSFTYIDVPLAGTYTYEIYASNPTGGTADSLIVNRVALDIFEL
jgi:hypothetical protein